MPPRGPESGFSRRRFLGQTAAAGTALVTRSGIAPILADRQPPAFVSGDRPSVEHGIQLGDVTGDRAIVWGRADRGSRMFVEWDTTPRFAAARRVQGPDALPDSDFTTRLDLTGLPSDEHIFLRVTFEDLLAKRGLSQPVLGYFRTAPSCPRAIRLLWSGDTCGQGWGINPEIGGMRIYKTMLDQDPDFFIHNGDNIYADGPLEDTVQAPDGGVWRNAFLDRVPSKRKVAESLDEFRGCYRYNLCDANLLAFGASVPQVWQWNDHETLNNWSASKSLAADDRYLEKDLPTLVSRARRAFLEYAPLRLQPDGDGQRLYRRLPYGPQLDLFVIDLRSYRGPNSYNRQRRRNRQTSLFGSDQLAWLKNDLLRSTARWKIIACDAPLGLTNPDGRDAKGRQRYESAANGNGPPLGRELELAELLSFLKRHRVHNLIWLTGDFHYTAAHHYDPQRAVFKDFDPFWEFVSGPLNAGSYPMYGLDNTFGLRVVFQKAPPAGTSNLPPSAGYQFFGQVDIDMEGELLVTLKDLEGKSLFQKALRPANQHA
jgi:alkaline phosphatase D